MYTLCNFLGALIFRGFPSRSCPSSFSHIPRWPTKKVLNKKVTFHSDLDAPFDSEGKEQATEVNGVSEEASKNLHSGPESLKTFI